MKTEPSIEVRGVRMYHKLAILGGICLSLFLSIEFGVSDVSSETRLDDIKIFYHGLALDDSRRPIEITENDLLELYRELSRAVLAASSPEGAALKAVKSTQWFAVATTHTLSPNAEPTTVLISKLDFVVDILVDENQGDPTFLRDYGRHLETLRSIAGSTRLRDMPPLHDPLQPYFDAYKARSAAEYKLCSDASVPIPPDYGSTLWSERLKLSSDDSLVQQDVPEGGFFPETEILFYKSTSPTSPGLCALLKRYAVTDISDKQESLQIVAVICESYETGKSCFWQKNLYVNETGKKLTDEELRNPMHSNINLSWPNSNNGKGSVYSTKEDCTSCHTGSNAFIFYQGTDLCYNEKFKSNGTAVNVADAPCFGKRDQWSKPIGIEATSPIDLGEGQNKCMTCHALAVSQRIDQYCQLLKFVTGRFMPPNKEKIGLSWVNPQPGHDYNESVAQLKKYCPPPKN
jgi:hypothetical protein